MSKVIKNMEMDALRKSFGHVRDLVALSITKLGSIPTSNLRASLRKKKIKLQVVKNSLTRKVFGEMGIAIPADYKDKMALLPFWAGPTALAWGAGSIAELSRAIEGEVLKGKAAAPYKDKVTVKGAVADGQPVPFEQALKMPTREEAIGQILAMILSGGADIAGCLVGPSGQVASQIKQLAEKEGGEAAKEGAEAAPAAPAP
jgi:large subunit ribosomal protein L10